MSHGIDDSAPEIVLDETREPSGFPNTPSSRMRLYMDEQHRPITPPPVASLSDYRLEQTEVAMRRIEVKVDALTQAMNRIETLSGGHFPDSEGKVMREQLTQARQDIAELKAQRWQTSTAIIGVLVTMLFNIVMAFLMFRSHTGN